jgi:hypothetical protein
MDSEQARAHAERFFTRRQAEKAEAARAREEYEAGQCAMREKTARLRALRLARDVENGDRRLPAGVLADAILVILQF